MSAELAGLTAYLIATWAALLIFDEKQNRRRVDSWRARAERIRHMRGTP